MVSAEPRGTLVNERPRALDVDSMSPAIALPLLAAELRALTEVAFPHLSDLTVDLVVDPGRGVCSLHFRATR